MTMTFPEIKALMDEAKTFPEFVEALTKKRWDSTGDEGLGAAAYELKYAAERLRKTAEIVARRAIDLIATLAGGSPDGAGGFTMYCGINSSGELQGYGPAFDVDCALYAAAHARLGAKISARKDKHVEDYYASALTTLAGVEADVVANLKNGLKTCVKLSRNTGHHLDAVEAAVNDLVARHFLILVGNYVKLNTSDAYFAAIAETNPVVAEQAATAV